MEDLTLKPAYQEDYPVAPLPEPLASNPVQPAAGDAQETPSAAQSSSHNTATPVTPAEGEETTSTTTQSKGKAPAREDPLTLGHTPSEEPAAKGDMVVEILLISTAASSRHPFKITERYLTKRNVNVPGVTVDGKMDILSITVYSLKELILREWRREWETAPREPASIRLIRLGKMLDDKATLQSEYYPFPLPFLLLCPPSHSALALRRLLAKSPERLY
ncbi:uncharacterized protein PG986_004916 [Apiospora aurea]|uniref:UBL3-like ubiquitin domain-containing protein n=1 Tax=Apiospora aurea TaxID=335848 RepID=A0ABR1QGG2_9PEZI